MSHRGPSQHLDAFSGRDVVFCHACEHEWYQTNQHELTCPECDSEATEIVTADSDPRHIEDDNAAAGPGRRPHDSDDADSDPEEADIEEHTQTGPGGVVFSQRVYRNPMRHEPGAERSPAHPANQNAVHDRFFDMLGGDFRASRVSTVRTTNFPGGSTSFTITTAPLRTEREVQEAHTDFNTILGEMMRNMTPPVANRPHEGDNGGNNGENNSGENNDRPGLPPHGFPIAFHQLLSALFGGPSGINMGDVVNSQEELDRILTQMMEATAPSNAAPPASQAALDKLERKKLDAKMIGTDGGKVECTICMDEIKEGDDVTVLPCKHFFDDECVVIWLKEHNTCPICRAPVEERASSSAPAPAQDQRTTPTARAAVPVPVRWTVASVPLHRTEPSSAAPRTRSGPSFQNELDNTNQSDNTERDSTRQRRRLLRSPSNNEERLDAIRNATRVLEETMRSTTPPPRAGGNNRRNSMSPPSPSQQEPWNLRYDQVRDFTRGSRDRARGSDGDGGSGNGQSSAHNWNERRWPRMSDVLSRSPSNTTSSASGESSDRRQQGSESGSGAGSNATSGGPLSWIRDRFPSSGSSSGGSGEGRRRS